MNETNKPLFTTGHWRKLRESIDRLDALSTDAREAELERIAAADPELVDALRDFADTDAVPETLPPIPAARIPSDAMPAQVGPFHLLREIGAGGMGVVYLAERQGLDFTQRVALKLLDGGASRMARLAARERNILAALAHPSITAFVDAGMENGRAWLAMEYVDGEPLLEHCARLGSGMRERVCLFDQVCAAVAHAHAQLVVHRDLKPSNVLVNGAGAVKLLDFGIAIVLDPGEAQTPATQVFTPEYAAPEQLRGERVTTATDVYALGLMLYELLCGKRLPTLGHDSEWTTAELARFCTNATGNERNASADVRTPVRLLRGDLGRIVAHALASEPAHRYPTVTSLREDLQRWLDHRPLGIERPRLAYAAARFMRRHRAAVAVAALSVVGLIATCAYALWQAHEARLMAARADHARSFLNTLFLNADPYNAKHGAENMIGFLRDAGQRTDTEFADAPEMAILLRSTIASALLRLDQPKPAYDLYLRNVNQAKALYGARAPEVGEGFSNLARASEDSGDIDAARKQYEQAYSILKDAGEDYARARVSVMTGLGGMALRRSDYADAEYWSELVLRERMAHEGPRSPDIAMDLQNLANDAMYQEHFAKALSLAQRAHAMLEKVLGRGHPRSIYIDNTLGIAQLYMGHCADAVATITNALAVARSNLPPGAHMLGSVLGNLGRAQACAGDAADGIANLRQALAIASAAHDLNIGTIELRLGTIELQAHDPEAERMLAASRKDLSATSSRFQGAKANLLWADAAYGDALAEDGKATEGENLAREARTKIQAYKDSGSSTLAEIDLLLADIRSRESDTAEAHTLREEALQIFQRVYGADHAKTHELARQLASTANSMSSRP